MATLGGYPQRGVFWSLAQPCSNAQGAQKAICYPLFLLLRFYFWFNLLSSHPGRKGTAGFTLHVQFSLFTLVYTLIYFVFFLGDRLVEHSGERFTGNRVNVRALCLMAFARPDCGLY